MTAHLSYWSSIAYIPLVTHFLALKNCVTKGKCVILGMSVRLRDKPKVTHVPQKCVTKRNIVLLREKISDMCHSGFVTKSHRHTLSDTFSLGDTIFQRQKMCH